MPRKQYTEEVVLSTLRRFTSDKKCPYSYRMFSTLLLGIYTRMFDESLVKLIPGIHRYKVMTEPESSVEDAVRVEKEGMQEKEKNVVSEFLNQLSRGGGNGNSKT